MPRAITHIIEYQPYRYRNECCAVGLLLLLPDGEAQVRVAHNLRKVRDMHPATNLDDLRSSLERVGADISADQTLLPLYLTGSVGPLRINPNPGYLDFNNADELEAGVTWAMAYMVEPTVGATQRERPAVSRLFVEVKSYFANMGWLTGLGQGIRDHRIVARYALSAEEGLNVDFALLNSSMHYLQTADFRAASNPSQKRHEVQAKWFALGLADALTPADISGAGIKRYAVIAGAGTDEGKKAVKAAHRVANGGVFVSESSDDMESLMAIYSKAMGQEPLGKLPTH